MRKDSTAYTKMMYWRELMPSSCLGLRIPLYCLVESTERVVAAAITGVVLPGRALVGMAMPRSAERSRQLARNISPISNHFVDHGTIPRLGGRSGPAQDWLTSPVRENRTNRLRRFPLLAVACGVSGFLVGSPTYTTAPAGLPLALHVVAAERVPVLAVGLLGACRCRAGPTHDVLAQNDCF